MFLLIVICKLSRGLPRKAGCRQLKNNVKIKHQSETQYIEGTKREFSLLYALKCATNFKCESYEISMQVQKTCSCAKKTTMFPV